MNHRFRGGSSVLAVLALVILFTSPSVASADIPAPNSMMTGTVTVHYDYDDPIPGEQEFDAVLSVNIPVTTGGDPCSATNPCTSWGANGSTDDGSVTIDSFSGNAGTDPCGNPSSYVQEAANVNASVDNEDADPTAPGGQLNLSINMTALESFEANGGCFGFYPSGNPDDASIGVGATSPGQYPTTIVGTATAQDGYGDSPVGTISYDLHVAPTTTTTTTSTTPPCTTPPKAENGTYRTRVASRLDVTLKAEATCAPITQWNLIHQSFGTKSWRFKWHGDGTFSLIQAGKGPVSLTYSVTAADGRTSAPATATMSAADATFASVGSANEATPLFVGMGDSYSSGEGNPPFLPGTGEHVPGFNLGGDGCDRSDASYAYKEWAHLQSAHIPQLHFLLTACSGAHIKNILYNGQKSGGLPQDRVPQVNALKPYLDNSNKYVRFITLTAGGNDANFGPILERCAADKVGGFTLNILTPLAQFLPTDTDRCDKYADKTDDQIALNKLQDEEAALYDRLLASAPDADIFVLDYPRLFSTDGKPDVCLIPRDSRETLDDIEYNVDAAIGKAVHTVQVNNPEGYRLHRVSLNYAGAQWNDHELCDPGHTSWLNGAQQALENHNPHGVAHPTGAGHDWERTRLDAVMENYLGTVGGS